MNILAKTEEQAKQFANGQPYRYIKSSKDLFNHTDVPTHVLPEWKSMKRSCVRKRLVLMLKGMELSPRIEVVRHDID